MIQFKKKKKDPLHMQFQYNWEKTIVSQLLLLQWLIEILSHWQVANTLILLEYIFTKKLTQRLKYSELKYLIVCFSPLGLCAGCRCLPHRHQILPTARASVAEWNWKDFPSGMHFVLNLIGTAVDSYIENNCCIWNYSCFCRAHVKLQRQYSKQKPFYHVILDKIRKYEAPIVLKVH